MWCSVGVMLLLRAQHNLANIYDPIKNKLASVNKILCSLRYWGVMLLIYISIYNPQPMDLPYQYGFFFNPEIFTDLGVGLRVQARIKSEINEWSYQWNGT